MKKGILEEILVIGIFGTLFIPLIGLTDLAFPFVTSKAFTFRILTEVLGGIWLLLAISDKRYRPRFSWITTSVIVLLGITAVADILGVNIYRSFWGSFERMDGFINILHLSVYFFVAGTILNTEKRWDSFLNTTIGISVALSLLGLIQLFGGMTINTDAGRLDATFGNAAFLGTYLLLHIFVVLFMLVRKKNGRPRYLYIYGVIAILHTFILYLTATRSAMIGLIGGIFLTTVLISIFERENKIIRRVATGVIFGIILLIGGFVLLREQPFVKQNPILGRFTEISLTGAKDQARFYLWTMAIKGFKDRPILGWGQENFRLVFLKYYHPALYNDEIIFDRPHNVVLEWMVSAGLLGALGYLSLFVAVLYYIWFSKRGKWTITEKSILTGFLAGYLINGLFLFDNLSSYIIFFSFLSYVHSSTLPEYQEDKIRYKQIKKIEKERQEKMKTFSIPVAFAVLISIYFVNAKAFLAASEYATAVQFTVSDPEKSLAHSKKALGYNSFGGENIRQNIVVLASNVRFAERIDPGVKKEYYNFARREMEKLIEVKPPDAHNYYLLGSLSYLYGQHADAISYLEQARKLSPKKQVILLKLREVYLVEKQIEMALALAKEAYELDPRYPSAQLAYAASLMYTDVPLSSALFSDSLRLLEQYIVQVPHDIHARLALASAYRKMGRLDKVLKEIEKVVGYEPSLKSEAEVWIRGIKQEMNQER